MRIERVVVDASPLIILFKSVLTGLLPQLVNEIVGQLDYCGQKHHF